MSEIHKIDHVMREQNGFNSVGNGAELSRQVTVQMSSEQYERLFFQPSAPRRGDFAKRFGTFISILQQERRTELTPTTGNPTLLGLIGFLIPYTSTILILCGFQGAVAPQSLVGLSGDYYFFGCIVMNIAGIAEFILGNSMYLRYPFTLILMLISNTLSIPNGSLSHLWKPLGQPCIHSGSNSSNHSPFF